MNRKYASAFPTRSVTRLHVKQHTGSISMRAALPFHLERTCQTPLTWVPEVLLAGRLRLHGKDLPGCQ